jgi:tetratricopeptide (TPR) repeat protein
MPVYVPRVSAELAVALALEGRADEAMPIVERAVEQAAVRKQAASHVQVLLLLAEVRLLSGRVAEAEMAALSALEHSRRQNERGHEAWALRLLGETHVRRSPPDVTGAESRYRAARDLASELGMTPLLERCDRALRDLGRPSAMFGGG